MRRTRPASPSSYYRGSGASSAKDFVARTKPFNNWKIKRTQSRYGVVPQCVSGIRVLTKVRKASLRRIQSAGMPRLSAACFFWAWNVSVMALHSPRFAGMLQKLAPLLSTVSPAEECTITDRGQRSLSIPLNSTVGSATRRTKKGSECAAALVPKGLVISFVAFALLLLARRKMSLSETERTSLRIGAD